MRILLSALMLGSVCLPTVVTSTALAAEPQDCTWNGAWETYVNGEPVTMTLTEVNRRVTGTYGPDGRKIEANLFGGGDIRLSGRWSAPPTFRAPDHAGELYLERSRANCDAFAGSWVFGQGVRRGGDWVGWRVGRPAATGALLAAGYLRVLCRRPDPAGQAQWEQAPATWWGLLDALGNSDEGRVVAAYRQAYLDTLGRDPALPYGFENGCTALRRLIDTGVPLDEVYSALPASPEGQRVRQVRDAFIELLGRDPLGADNAGLRYWVDSGLHIARIRQLLMDTDEYRQRAAQNQSAEGAE